MKPKTFELLQLRQIWFFNEADKKMKTKRDIWTSSLNYLCEINGFKLKHDYYQEIFLYDLFNKHRLCVWGLGKNKFKNCVNR